MFKLHRYKVAILSAIVANSYFFSFFSGKIYQGKGKYICFPGLNCYSCPLSIFSCPVGALQQVYSQIRFNFLSGKYILGFYIIGFLGIIGTFFGRSVCGWICPFGFFQEIMFRLPSRKFEVKNKSMEKLKYIMLFAGCIIIPAVFLDKYGIGEPFFCKYVCPAGTLEAGLTIPFLFPEIRNMIGYLYFWKISLLGILILSFVFIKRPFCRFLCPLGAFYSIFNKVSFVKVERKEDKCIECLKCVNVCPMGLELKRIGKDLNCINCFECKKVCPVKAIN